MREGAGGAIGRIEPRFPSLGLEKEFAQAAGRAETAGLTDRETVHAVLSDPGNTATFTAAIPRPEGLAEAEYLTGTITSPGFDIVESTAQIISTGNPDQVLQTPISTKRRHPRLPALIWPYVKWGRCRGWRGSGGRGVAAR
jgi:hypothetical protein